MSGVELALGVVGAVAAVDVAIKYSPLSPLESPATDLKLTNS